MSAVLAVFAFFDTRIRAALLVCSNKHNAINTSKEEGIILIAAVALPDVVYVRIERKLKFCWT